jgi:hypothetical protein
MTKKIVQIIILLIPFIILLFIISCKSNVESEYSGFLLEKDMKNIDSYLSKKDLILVEHRKTSNQQFLPSEAELSQPLIELKDFPNINFNSKCVDYGLKIESLIRNYPLFILDSNKNILAYLVKFPNSTGIIFANKKQIPVILLDDLLKYLGC